VHLSTPGGKNRAGSPSPSEGGSPSPSPLLPRNHRNHGYLPKWHNHRISRPARQHLQLAMRWGQQLRAGSSVFPRPRFTPALTPRVHACAKTRNETERLSPAASSPPDSRRGEALGGRGNEALPPLAPLASSGPKKDRTRGARCSRGAKCQEQQEYPCPNAARARKRVKWLINIQNAEARRV